jgi:hypothetical protein
MRCTKRRVIEAMRPFLEKENIECTIQRGDSLAYIEEIPKSAYRTFFFTFTKNNHVASLQMLTLKEFVKDMSSHLGRVAKMFKDL